MSAGRTSRSWSRTRSIDSSHGRAKRQSKDSGKPSVRHGSIERSDDVATQRFVLTDPIAFRYLEDDSSVSVLDLRREISGYQTYIVEQWATSRAHPTFTITIYTGDSSDRIVANVLGIPPDESLWSARLKAYFKALNHFHAKRRDTPDGVVMTTSLPGFPSSLTVIQVPDGDVSKHYADFFVNEDLKRLGCSGRLGLTLAYPNNATVAKYYQLYRTSEKIPLYGSVIELVRMCQMALYMFDLLEQDFIDGLLCDVTEKAVLRWWAVFGNEIYNHQSRDGILGPSTVAALLGLYCGARNRLHALSAPAPKDPFDLDAMKRAVHHFQKSQKISKSRRLDEKTLFRLHSVTEKAANAEGWRIPTAVKTTVAELQGKGEEMVQEGTGRKTKAGIADVETTDIDAFEQLIVGDRCKWLWQGKALKRSNTAHLGETAVEGYSATKKTAPVEDHHKSKSERAARHSLEDTSGSRTGRNSLEEEQPLVRSQTYRGAAAKKVQGVFDDGRAGIDRLREAVNIHKRPLDSERTETAMLSPTKAKLPRELKKRPGANRSYTSPNITPSESVKSKAASSGRKRDISPVRPPLNRVMTDVHGEQKTSTQEASQSLNEILKSPQRAGSSYDGLEGESQLEIDSIPNSPDYHGVNLDDALPVPGSTAEDIPTSLRRTRSETLLSDRSHWSDTGSQAVVRHLSFSAAVGSMFTSSEVTLLSTDDEEPESQYAQQRFIAGRLKSLRDAISRLSQNEAAWSASQIDALASQLRQADEDQEALREYYEVPAQAAQNMRDMASAVLRVEQEILSEGKREIDTLVAKLDYDIANLRAKIEDVELNVDDFEKAVAGAEQRVDEVEREIEGKAGWSCVVS